MAGSTFQTNPYDLHKLLDDCHRGLTQLPDFQRSWVWDEDRIKSLIASVSRAFPVGALMSLDTGGPVNFKPRTVEGTPEEAKLAAPQWLLLDGQQRMTSLYQVTIRGKVVETVSIATFPSVSARRGTSRAKDKGIRQRLAADLAELPARCSSWIDEFR